MKIEDILNAIQDLAQSQGFYGRLLRDLLEIRDTDEERWQEIVLNSLFTKDYDNSFGIRAKECKAFFDGYVEYLYELAQADGGVTHEDTYTKYDNSTNLYDWWLMVVETL